MQEEETPERWMDGWIERGEIAGEIGTIEATVQSKKNYM